MTEQDFTEEFGMTITEAEQIVLAMKIANQKDWNKLIADCFKVKNPTPKYFMKYYAKRMKTKKMLKGLGYEIH